MQPSLPPIAASLSRRCPSCKMLYPLNAPHRCAAMAETLAGGPVTVRTAPPSDALSEAGDSSEILTSALPGTIDPDDLIGAIVGERYEILSRLDHGGMGVVYKARHTVLEYFLAVKILLRPQDEEARRRFLLEAKLASKLNHPNTVYLSDFGVLEDGRSYLIMELLSGSTLAKALKSGKMDTLRACSIAVQIARGLCAVHGAGIVHRDLKPENIFLLEQDGQPDFVKIVDFGIAKDANDAAGSSAIIDPVGSTGKLAIPPEGSENAPPIPEPTSKRFTGPGTLLGTPLYMAPEQAEGQPTDARTDQYAFGCILYEMLTGHVPFEAVLLSELLEKHAKSPVIPPRERVGGVEISDRLELLVLRLLEKKVDDRFGSLREVEQILVEEIDLVMLKRGDKVTVSREAARQLSDPVVPAPKRRWPIWLFLFTVLGCAGLGVWEWQRQTRNKSMPANLLPGEQARLRATAVATLKDQTRNSDPELRRSAIAALGQTKEEWLEPTLEEVLSSPDSETQAEAATALGNLGAKEALTVLRAFPDRNQPAHLTIAVAAARAKLGDADGERLLEEALNKKDAELSHRAAVALCERPHPKARAVLAEHAKRWDLARPMAVEFWSRLVQCGDDTARDRLRAELVNGEVLDVPLLAASKLAQLGDAEGLAFLHRLIERPEYMLRAWKALAQAGMDADTNLFRRTIEDRSGLVPARVLAAQGLGYVGRPIDARMLGEELAASNDARLRQALAIAILQLGAKADTPPKLP